MGIVTATNNIEARLLDHPHVTAHGLLGHGIAPAGLVLVYVGTMEVVVFPVQEESPVGCPLKPAEAKGVLLLVYQFPAVVQLAHQGVQPGMGGRPKRDTRQLLGGLVEGDRLTRIHFLSSFLHGQDLSMTIHHLGAERIAVRLARLVHHLGAHSHHGGAALVGRKRGRGNPRAIPVDMHGMLLHQSDVAIDATAEDMLAATGSQVGSPQVVHPHGHLVVSLPRKGRDADAEARISASVRSR